MAIPVIGYVRVSRVAGREGDSFLSPELQRQEIERECERSKLVLVDTYEELDASGGDNARPLWNRAIERVELGEAKGIVVWNLSRFSRSVVDALSAIDRIERVGGAVFSASGDVGDSTPTGKLTRNIVLSLAQMERERAKDGFRAAQASAIQRGIFTASHIPVGYVRNSETRKLEPNPEMAPKVKELFERRKAGNSWTSLATWFVLNGASPKTDLTAIKWIISNRTYLGEARWGNLANKTAHPPIVSQKLFDDANAVKGKKPKHDGSLASQTRLRGLVTCEGCGHIMGLCRLRLGITGYACRTITCTAHAGCNAPKTDAEVVSRVMAYLNRNGASGYVESHESSPQEVESARKALEDAQYDRKLFMDNRELRRLMTPQEYNAEFESLNELVEEAQIAHEMAKPMPKQPQTVTDFQTVWDEWSNEDQREWLADFVGTVVVKTANKRRIPVSDRLGVMVQEGRQERWLLPDGTYSDEPFSEERAYLARNERLTNRKVRAPSRDSS
jgi:site-specific DNA recombinase